MGTLTIAADRGVRDMLNEEVEQVTRLLDVIGTLYPDGDRWLRGRLRDVALGSAHCRVALLSGEIRGVAILTPKSSDVVKLSTLYVAEAARGLHLGSSLIDAVLGEMDKAGVRETYVTVAHHLADELTRLLQPRGFTQVAFEPNRYGPGRHEVVLSRIYS